MACLDSIGVIELVGLATAIECADAAVKAAHVRLLGYELSKGGGMVTIKISGNVGAVQAAVAAGTAASARVGTVVSKIIIPRPHRDLDQFILSKETVPAFEAKEEERENGGLAWGPGQESEEFDEGDATPVNPGWVDEEEITEPAERLEEDGASDAPLDQNNPGDPSARNEMENSRKATCNICNDPQCPRQKGEPHVNCLHFKSEKR
ncbi:BMC domain-containing protein [Candidatus Formimonas warabiya]|uniref:BMC domain-containing protein n=1 Tax=Formimonas warabiya TaxID=1761012 RepID=UPI0022B278A2|nr:BMC domain-containing protein [Candidatus Formimonas warabiya]